MRGGQYSHGFICGEQFAPEQLLLLSSVLGSIGSRMYVVSASVTTTEMVSPIAKAPRSVVHPKV